MVSLPRIRVVQWWAGVALGGLLALLPGRLGAATAALPPAPDESPAVPPAASGIHRVMTMLAASTPTDRRTVRVLFYGQSITTQAWWRVVADHLRQTYPHANLIIENRGIGGFASQLLWRTAESDLYPFYPDLVIFHVYGADGDYERIIRNIRSRTTADVLQQTDHITSEAELTEPTNPALVVRQSEAWPTYMNQVWLPHVSRKYGTALADVRHGWKRYLREHDLAPAALLSDQVHLNDRGCEVMAELVVAALRQQSAATSGSSAIDDERVKEWVVGRDVQWHGGRLVLPFEGNRVDLVVPADTNEPPRTAQVRIDGRSPAEFVTCYTATRATAYPGTIWPAVLRVRGPARPEVEEWTMEILEADDALERVRFRVTGSVTGPDGEGWSTEPFVSQSGRVAIAPDDWHLARSRAHTQQPMPAGFVIRWKIEPQFVETFTLPPAVAVGVERVATVVQGLPNGPHQLTLEAVPGQEPPVTLVRVYRPPLTAAPDEPR